MLSALLPYGIMIMTGAAAFWREAPYAVLPLLILMACWYSIRLVLTKGAQKTVVLEKDRRRERVLTTTVFAGMVLLPLVALATPLLDLAAYQAVSGQVSLGVAIGLGGSYLFWRSHADLGREWSAHLELREDHRLVTSGIYATMRHPMYTALFLITAAQALVLANWIAGPAGLAAFTLLYVRRIDAEERMMREQFGDGWDAYSSRTPRLIPRLLATRSIE
ncbi:MAG: protein-S-isoprenylcysteine O-methyltransferase [Pseudomonadota bacterium]